MNTEFLITLIEKIVDNNSNYYTDNYDYYRFGKRKVTFFQSIRKLVAKLYKRYRRLAFSKSYEATRIKQMDKYLSGYLNLQQLLDDSYSTNNLVDILAYKILGPYKYKMKLSSSDYFSEIEKMKELAEVNNLIKPNFYDYELKLHNLEQLGFEAKLYHTHKAIYTNFVLKQYEYEFEDIVIKAEPGDYVIDAGACWGDTPIYFADLVGDNGKVFAFEFVPSNLKVFNQNLEINPNLEKRIEIITQPLHSSPGQEFYFIENGPGTKVFMQKTLDLDFEIVLSSSIDHFVKANKIEKVDFIKMDIEGAETEALKGSVETIQKFKPKLAISIYHSEDDFVSIPQWINNLNLGYRFYLDHYTIYKEETVLYCIAN